APVAPVLTPPGARSRLVLFGFWRPIRRAGFFFFAGTLDRQTSLTGTTTLARLESSTEGRAVRALPFVRLERDAPVGVPAVSRWFSGASVFVLPRPGLGPVLGPIWLRGGGEVESDGPLRLSSYSLLAARSVCGTSCRSSPSPCRSTRCPCLLPCSCRRSRARCSSPVPTVFGASTFPSCRRASWRAG